MSQGKADPKMFVQRFEALKRQWFYSPDTQYDEEGEELPSMYGDRAAIAAQFDNMGLEIPMTPDEQPIPKGQRRRPNT